MGEQGAGAWSLPIFQMSINRSSTAVGLACVRRFNELFWVYRAYRPPCAHC